MIPSLYYRYYGHIVGPAAIASAFRQRVEADGGTFEAEECLKDRIDALGPFYSQASLVMLPHGAKANKLYSTKPENGTGDFAFTRTGTRTRKAATFIETVATGVPALDYTSDSSCPALSLEPARTNVLLHSEDFSNAAWSLNSMQAFGSGSTTNAIAGPDGLTTADLLSISAAGGHVFQAFNSNAATYAASFYVKGGSSPAAVTDIGLYNFTGGAFIHRARFTWATKTIATAEGTGTSGAEELKDESGVATGWYRIWITGTYAAAVSARTYLYPAGAGAGVAGNNVYAVGAQLEQSSYATSYIPTTTATVSRVADAVTALTGVSDLIGQTEGTLYFEGRVFEGSVHKQISLCDGTTNERITLAFNATNALVCYVSTLATGGTVNMSTTYTVDTDYKVAVVYSESRVALFVNGVLINQDVTVTLPTMSQIKFNDGGSGSIFYGEGEALMLIKTALSDADAISLTTP
jgi:hypothetical protein